MRPRRKRYTKAQMVERIRYDLKNSEKLKKEGLNLVISESHLSTIISMVYVEIWQALQKNLIVELRGFGTFLVAHRKGGQKRNPKTGELVTVPEHGAVKFKPTTALNKTVFGIYPEAKK